MGFAPNRVLHLIHSQELRGAEVFATELACCLEKGRSFQNAVCSLYNGVDALAANGLPMFNLEGQEGLLEKRIGLDFLTLSKFWRLLRRYRPGIILAHGSSTLKYAAAGGVLYRNAATIYRNIGTASVWANSSARASFNRLLLKRIDAVVSVSQYTRQDFLSLYRLAPERVAFIPNGVDTSRFDRRALALAGTEVRQALGLSQTDLVFITVGSLSPEKGHQALLQLMAELQGLDLKNHLLLVGDGPLRGRLERQARELDIADRVHFLRTRADVPRFLAAADLFLLCSRTEGMPGCLIEAGLAGLASVSFDVGGVAEVVEHRVTGLVVSPGDFQGLRQAVLGLCRDPQRRAAMGAAARQRCLSLFDIRKVASDYETLFLKTLVTPRIGNNGRP